MVDNFTNYGLAFYFGRYIIFFESYQISHSFVKISYLGEQFVSENLVNGVADGLKPVIMEIICDAPLTTITVSRPEHLEPFRVIDNQASDFKDILQVISIARTLTVGRQVVDAVGIVLATNRLSSQGAIKCSFKDQIARIVGMTTGSGSLKNPIEHYKTIPNAKLLEGIDDSMTHQQPSLDLAWNGSGFQAISAEPGIQSYAAMPDQSEQISRHPALYLIGPGALAMIPGILTNSATYNHIDASISLAA
jgi:hypothetical protein